MGKAEVPISPCHIFYLILLKVIFNWAVVVWKQHKTERNTFCVISEPHLLVVITKAYVSGFYIHITSSGLYIHTRESSQAKWRFTKDNINGRGSSVHIYNIKNVSRLIKQGKMEVKQEKKIGIRPGKCKWWFFIIGCSDSSMRRLNSGKTEKLCRPQKVCLQMSALSPRCTFSSCAYHLFTWVGLITHSHSHTHTHTHTCECYKFGKGGKQSKAVIASVPLPSCWAC